MSQLANIPLFADLPADDLARIETAAQIRQFDKGQLIIREGDKGDAMFLLLNGRVKVYVSDNHGKEFILAVLDSGEYVGELALIDDERRTATVETEEDSTFLVLRKEDFLQLLHQSPAIQLKLLTHLVGRVRNLTESVKNLALRDVYSRVRLFLEGEAVTNGDGLTLIEEPLTQQAIADRVGSSREMIARILKELVFGAYVRIDNKRLILLQKLPEHF